MTEDPVPPKSDNYLHSLKHQLSFTTLNSDRIEKIKRGAGAAGQIFPLYSSFFYRHVNRCCRHLQAFLIVVFCVVFKISACYYVSLITKNVIVTLFSL